ncbi:four helix bundle protein [Muriicola jejuensis]|uniref:Four helix bundle protein n=2 Tax=Muriicola jejuensis TaxID=504488 RepID=A0A6P0UEE2_9FLAO|nr:four helix bundle protein [Muriicola jejuensis]SMP07261.1 four helix bundle protein [Muriicola jejuensis]
MMKNRKVYDLEERTYSFARDCRIFIKKLPKTLGNVEDGKQLIKSSGSIGANYIEANEKLGERDLYMRLKIARKEAKEASYWLRLLRDMNDTYEKEAEILIDEVLQLRMILSSILNKVSKSKEEII